MMKDLNDQTNIFELHQKADFGKLQEGHEARFMHYLDFLHQNGLETIYDENGDAIPERVITAENLKDIKNVPNLYYTFHSTPNRKLKGFDQPYEEYGIQPMGVYPAI